jgi:peptidyl-prolyl cis-trans isomerase SurA
VQKGKDLGINVESQVLRQRDAIMKQYKIATIEEFEKWATEKAGMPVEDLMDQMRDNFLSNNVLGSEVGSRIIIKREEIEQYYNEHKDEFNREEGVRLAEILISNEGALTDEERAEVEKKAREVHDRVQKGEPFAEMARRFSDSLGSKENGGDIGIWRRGSLRADLEERVFDKNPGYITELIEANNGYLILKVVEKFREGLAELEEVEEEIRNKLSGPRYGPAIREYLTDLRYDAYIEIRPGYVDLGAAPGKDTSWTDPAKLAPVTTTRDEVLKKGKKKKLLWMIPLPGGKEKDKAGDADSASSVGGDN